MALVQAAFRYGRLEEESNWQAVVLIPKWEVEYRCIVLLEVVWKVVEAIINRRITASTSFHGVLHSFRACRGTGNTTLKAKLLHQLAVMREEVLYMIFLELHNPYDALNRDRYLDILEGYRMGPWSNRILQEYWDRLRMVARVGGYYGATFKGSWG